MRDAIGPQHFDVGCRNDVGDEKARCDGARLAICCGRLCVQDVVGVVVTVTALHAATKKARQREPRRLEALAVAANLLARLVSCNRHIYRRVVFVSHKR